MLLFYSSTSFRDTVAENGLFSSICQNWFSWWFLSCCLGRHPTFLLASDRYSTFPIVTTCLEFDFTVTVCSSVIAVLSLQQYSGESYSSFFLHLSSSAKIATKTANSTLWPVLVVENILFKLEFVTFYRIWIKNLNNKTNQSHLNNNEKPHQTPTCYSSQYEYYSMHVLAWLCQRIWTRKCS